MQDRWPQKSREKVNKARDRICNYNCKFTSVQTEYFSLAFSTEEETEENCDNVFGRQLCYSQSVKLAIPARVVMGT